MCVFKDIRFGHYLLETHSLADGWWDAFNILYFLHITRG